MSGPVNEEEKARRRTFFSLLFMVTSVVPGAGDGCGWSGCFSVVAGLDGARRLLVLVGLSSESPCLRLSLIACAIVEISLSPRLDARQTNPNHQPHRLRWSPFSAVTGKLVHGVPGWASSRLVRKKKFVVEPFGSR